MQKYIDIFGYALTQYIHCIRMEENLDEMKTYNWTIAFRSVVSTSALPWFIWYIYYWNLQFLNNVIINKTKVLLPLRHRWPQPILAILVRPFGFIAPKTLNYLAFQSFDFERTWWRLCYKRIVCTKFDIT